MELLKLQRVLSQQYQQEVQEMCEGLNREAGLIHSLARVDSSSNDGGCGGGGSDGGSGGSGSGGSELLADPATAVCRQLLELLQPPDMPQAVAMCSQLLELSWEKLHTGNWKDVALPWRDCYSFACVLKASLDLHQQQQQQQQQQHTSRQRVQSGDCSQGTGSAEQQHLASALKQLDLGIMMGGPAFRPLLDAAVAELEERLQQCRQSGGGTAATTQSSFTAAEVAGAAPAAAVAVGAEGAALQLLLGGSEEGEGGGARKRARREQVMGDVGQAVTGEAGEGSEKLPLPFSGFKAQPPRVPQPVSLLLQDTTSESKHQGGAEGKEVVVEGKAQQNGHDEKAVGASRADAEGGEEGGDEEEGSDVEGSGSKRWGLSGGGLGQRRHRLALHKLPPRSLTQGEPQSSRPLLLHLPSLEQFLTEAMAGCVSEEGRPAIITGAMESWPALSRWQDVTYLEKVAGHRTVPVEVGQHYLADGWGQQLMTLSDFIARHIRGEQQREQGQQERQGQTGQEQGGRVGYLAQHPLFDQIPALKADILTPEYCVLGEGEVQSVNAWFGPEGTQTPLHTDPHNNLLAQVVGCKYVRLYAPSHTPHLYPHAEGLTTNTSTIDLMEHQGEDASYPQHPGFAGLPFQDCVLQAGQMLYIPPGWWHYVQSLSLSFSVSFWWK